MLQSLLIDRFGLKCHRGTKVGPVYVLSRGSGPLLLEDAKDKTKNPRGGVVSKPPDIADGEAFGTNITIPFLVRQIGADLDRPVLDHTGLTGSYDFHLAPVDPYNEDMMIAIFGAMHRLGLQLKSGTGPVDTFFIDSVTMPSEN